MAVVAVQGAVLQPEGGGGGECYGERAGGGAGWVRGDYLRRGCGWLGGVDGGSGWIEGRGLGDAEGGGAQTAFRGWGEA